MGDRDGRIEPLSIQLIPGDTAPRWDAPTYELTPIATYVTEQGTKSHLPMVDFVFEGPDGKRYVFTTSGRMVLALAASIRGVNLRNHGKAEP